MVRQHLQGTRSQDRQVIRRAALLLGGLLAAACQTPPAPPPLVLQTDFGLQDGAVSAMRGVALGVDRNLCVQDLTHEIPPFDIWAAAYRLHQTAPYWPAGAVFVSVVDPGVGTDRLPIVARDRDDRLFVTPDNGTLTLLLEAGLVTEARVIDVARHRRPGSAESHTFHGRDVFALVGAELAAGRIRWTEVGPPIAPAKLVRIDHPRAAVTIDGVTGRPQVSGFVPVLDVQFGNVWTNLPRELLLQHGIALGARLQLRVFDGERQAFDGELPFVRTFGDVPPGQPLAYINSLDNLAFALNVGDFARLHGIGSGPRWRIVVTPR